MKKCPQCGSDIPLSVNYCSHCGYSSEKINKGYSYGSTGKNNNNKSNLGLMIFLVIFFSPVIFFILMGIFLFIISIFIKDEIDDEIKPPIEHSTCTYLCDGGYREDDKYCYCDDGDIYDKEGNPVIKPTYDSSKIHLAPLDLVEWQKDIALDEPVVTILCQSENSACESYTQIVNDLALEYGFKVYFFNVDQLSAVDQGYLTDSSVIPDFHNIYPFTFIVKNNYASSARFGRLSRNSLGNLLLEAGVIKEFDYE